jgi:hypothetical protein
MVKRFMRTTTPKVTGIRQKRERLRRELSQTAQRTDGVSGSVVSKGVSKGRMQGNDGAGPAEIEGVAQRQQS